MPDDAAAPKTPRAMTTAEVMLAGGVSGVAARLLTHPMDTVKTQMQVQGAVAAAGGNRALHYRGVADAVAKIVANEGVRGFYRGFGAVFTGIPFASGAYFGGYEGAKMLVPADAFGPTATYIVTGMLAQSLSGVVYTPLDVVKERLQAQHVLGAASAGNYKHFAPRASADCSGGTGPATSPGGRGTWRTSSPTSTVAISSPRTRWV